MMILFLFIFAVKIVSAANLEGPSHGKKIVCYMHNWSNYRKDLGQFSIEDIDPSLCTNIVYSFAALNETTHTIRSGDRWQDLETDYGKAGYRRVVSLKELYPHLKVTISIGGWAEGSVKYSNMASSRANRDTFVLSVLMFLKEHNFDGLDMHWKFPTLRDGKPQDKANFVLLLKELKEAFATNNYLLTAAFGAGKSTMEAAYDLSKINRYVDYIHLLSFDYHGAWDGVVGSNAPLRGPGDTDQNNLEFSVTYLINNGVSPNKIILGLPAFGRTFTLKDPGTRDIVFGRTATEKVGFQGPYTAENGLMGYNEICTELNNKSSDWSAHWDARSATAFIRSKERVICYDSGRSVAVKVKMAVDRGLGGLMVWSLDTDDFRGLCAQESGAFVDFSARVETLAQDPRLPLAVKALSLPRGESLRDTDHYYVSDSRLALRLPRRAADLPYNVLRTTNEAATLATAERRIEDAMGGALGNDLTEDTGKAGFRPDYTYNSQLGYWFKVHSAALDWHTARLTCHYEGAELASPLNSELSAGLSGLIAKDSQSRWHYSGVHQSFGDGVYTTVRGVPLERLYIQWGEEPRGGRARCLALSAAGKAKEVNCEETLPFVCYRKYCDRDRVTECGTIDKEYKLDASTGHCYKLHTPLRWERAARVCAAEGGQLAVVNSEAEAAVLARVGGNQEVGMGIRQWGVNNEWTTVQGEPLQKTGFTSWCEDCPTSGRGCGGLKAGRLAPLDCRYPHPFICERAPDDSFNQNNLLIQINVPEKEKPLSFASFIQERKIS